jgi:hypothetical protein
VSILSHNDPNLFPGNWTVQTEQILKTFEQSFTQSWNPATLGWENLDGSGMDLKPRVAQAYWMSKLALFEKSGIGAFGLATLKAAIHGLEDPTKKFLASVTFDECRHDEVCRRACSKLCPGFPYNYDAKTEFERKALRNIQAMYEDGKRYWSGFLKAWEKYSLELIFSSFFFAEIGAQLIFHMVSEYSELEVYKNAFKHITVDESRHLSGTMSMLENLAQEMPQEQKITISRQMKHGFIFLSPLLYKPVYDFWRLPKDFVEVDDEMEAIAREHGLGVPTMEEKKEGWIRSVERKREQIERLGILIPAIPEIGLEGTEVKVDKNEPIATPL